MLVWSIWFKAQKMVLKVRVQAVCCIGNSVLTFAQSHPDWRMFRFAYPWELCPATLMANHCTSCLRLSGKNWTSSWTSLTT